MHLVGGEATSTSKHNCGVDAVVQLFKWTYVLPAFHIGVLVWVLATLILI